MFFHDALQTYEQRGIRFDQNRKTLTYRAIVVAFQKKKNFRLFTIFQDFRSGKLLDKFQDFF